MKKFNRFNRFLSIFLVVIILFPTIVQAAPLAEGSHIAKVERISGDNRVKTAIEVSKKAYKGQVETVFLAGYKGDADALTATFMAGKMEAPLLLADKEKLSDTLLLELKRLNPKEIIILGGEGALAQTIVDDLNSKGFNTRRIEGESRVQTAVNVAKDYYKDEKVAEVFLVDSRSLVDALAIGPVAAREGIPVLLTKKDTVPEEVISFIRSQGIEKITLVGGENTVSKKGKAQLENYVEKVDRVYGDDRIETSLNIAKEYFETPKSIFLANGKRNADALIGGYFANIKNGPIVLVKENEVRKDVENYIDLAGIDTYILGGKAVVSEYVYDLIEWIFTDGTKPKPQPKPQPQPKPEEKPEVPQTIPSISSVLSNKKDIENVIDKQIKAFNSNFTLKLSPKISFEDIENIIDDLYHTGTYRSGIVEETIYNFKSSSSQQELTLNIKYNTTKAQEDYINKKVGLIVKKIIKPNMTEFQKVRAVHDYIVRNTVYSEETKTSPHSAYTLLKYGKGVCQAYALATSKFFDVLNIKNYYVTGYAKEGGWGPHAWNMVRVDGKYYNMDVTWDDPSYEDGTDMLSYDYFLISDSEMKRDHRADTKNLPKATDKKYEALIGVGNPFEYKGRLYYGNSSDVDKIYSISLKDLTPKKISNLRSPSLVVYKEKIYFSNYSNGGYIYSMDLNGKNIKKLNSIHSTKLSLAPPYIKFFNENSRKWDKIKLR